MKRIDRRTFIQTGVAGIAGFTVIGAGVPCLRKNPDKLKVDRVKLNKTGLVVPRLALGTGSTGGGKQSNQTRIGRENFINMALHAWDRGVRFFDMADSYGSHTYVREVLKKLPREKSILMTKIGTGAKGQTLQDVAKTIDRFRMETGSDYFDIVLLHCMLNGKWQEEKKVYIEGLTRAKEDGIIKTLGVSCHNWDAMKVAVEDPWVEVLLARINPFALHMDNTPETVLDLLKTAHDKGKGIIGMKIFANGDRTAPADREQSIRFALQHPYIDCMTIGMESADQVDDAVELLMGLVKA